MALNGLRALEAAGRLGSLRAAAAELGVTVGAVSQQVHKAEQQLGGALLLRGPRGLRPTALGAEVLRRLSAGFSELAAAVALTERERGDVLTVSVAPVFAGKWLVWRLQRFAEQHPGVRLRLDATVALVDPSRSDVDACIRVGRGGWPGVQAEHLLDQRVLPVCSPGVAARLRRVEDLAGVPIIRDRDAMFGWEAWLGPHGADPAILGDGPVFSDASLCLDAAMAGQGVFLAWETLAADALGFGRLAAPLPGCAPTGLGYWFVTARDRVPGPRIRAFRAWLAGELAASIGTPAESGA